MIEIAKRQTGKVTVIVPHGVLFRGGSEGRIRQKLIEENLLDAVIGLPSGLFTTTGIPVAILIFDRSREQDQVVKNGDKNEVIPGGENKDRANVLFIDASRDFTSGKAKNILEMKHADKIVETYQARAMIERYSESVSFEEIKSNDFNLNIPRYVDTFEPEEEIDLGAVQKDIERLESELTDVRAKMTRYLKELGVDG